MTTSIILARWVVPVSSDSPHQSPISCTGDSDLIIPYGAVAVQENVIVAVGTADEVKAKYTENVEIVDLSRNHILIPGEFEIIYNIIVSTLM